MIVPRNSISFSLPQKADSQMEPANIADLIRVGFGLADSGPAEQLRRCAPKAFAERPRIGDKDTDKDKPKADMFSAGRPQRTAIPAFQILKDNILPD